MHQRTKPTQSRCSAIISWRAVRQGCVGFHNHVQLQSLPSFASKGRLEMKQKAAQREQVGRTIKLFEPRCVACHDGMYDGISAVHHPRKSTHPLTFLQESLL